MVIVIGWEKKSISCILVLRNAVFVSKTKTINLCLISFVRTEINQDLVDGMFPTSLSVFGGGVSVQDAAAAVNLVEEGGAEEGEVTEGHAPLLRYPM